MHVGCQRRPKENVRSPRSQSYRWLWITLWVLGIKPDLLQKQQVLSQLSSLLTHVFEQWLYVGFPQPLPRVSYSKRLASTYQIIIKGITKDTDERGYEAGTETSASPLPVCRQPIHNKEGGCRGNHSDVSFHSRNILYTYEQDVCVCVFGWTTRGLTLPCCS